MSVRFSNNPPTQTNSNHSIQRANSTPPPIDRVDGIIPISPSHKIEVGEHDLILPMKRAFTQNNILKVEKKI